jgi:hypothetical protein
MFQPIIFPSLDPTRDDQKHIPFRPFVSQSTMDHTGRRSPLNLTDEVLNWQTQNAPVQNRLLIQIDQKVDHVTAEVQTLKQTLTPLEQMYQDMVNRVQQHHKELCLMLQHQYHGPEFNQKERELRNLQKELDMIHQQNKRQSMPPKNPLSTFCPHFPTPSLASPPISILEALSSSLANLFSPVQSQ